MMMVMVIVKTKVKTKANVMKKDEKAMLRYKIAKIDSKSTGAFHMIPIYVYIILGHFKIQLLQKDGNIRSD